MRLRATKDANRSSRSFNREVDERRSVKDLSASVAFIKSMSSGFVLNCFGAGLGGIVIGENELLALADGFSKFIEKPTFPKSLDFFQSLSESLIVSASNSSENFTL